MWIPTEQVVLFTTLSKILKNKTPLIFKEMGNTIVGIVYLLIEF